MPNRNRTHGHNAERALAAFLRTHGYPEARTTRAALGHDGSRQPGDVSGVPGLSIEVKAVAKYDIGAWLRQAAIQSQGALPIVIVKPIGVGDPAEWWAIQRVTDALQLWGDP